METHAHAALETSQPRLVVIALEANVHHQFLWGGLFTKGALHVLGCTLKVLYALHHVGWHVLEQEFAVFVEEVLTIQQQGIHLSPIDPYLSATFHLNSRQLLYKGIEHRPFGHGESIGVVSQRVSIHVEL